MSEFMLLFRSGEAEYLEHMGTPERAQRSLQTWLAWIRDLEAKGHLKHPGQPLELAGKVIRGKTRVITDGPYAELGLARNGAERRFLEKRLRALTPNK